MSDKDDDKVRLDKWLWAARFYKTRALAKAAIEGGKVHHRGERCKPGKEPKVGDVYVIRSGFEERSVVVPSKKQRRQIHDFNERQGGGLRHPWADED
jgi:ribosome-associated heat shock protein Hsp15